MPRKQTPAAERARQRKATQDQVSAEVGKKVGVRAAARKRQAQKASPIPEGTEYLVKDRVVEYNAKETKRIGQVLARVVDFKIINAGFAQLALHTSASEFSHALADAAVISKTHPLLVTLDELVPFEADDADG